METQIMGFSQEKNKKPVMNCLKWKLFLSGACDRPDNV